MKNLFLLALIVLAGLLGYALFWPSAFDPQAWQAPVARQQSVNTDTDSAALANAERLGRGVARGPEDVAVDAQGRIYAGYADGTIRRFDRNGDNGEVFATTNGRPLGLDFAPASVAPGQGQDDGEGDSAGIGDNSQTLIVADADRGLLSINADGDIAVLATGAEGVAFRFTDDVDVADDGQIYFSDASSKYGRHAYFADILEHGGHGRLLQYDPETRETSVLLGGLQFANGVAVGPDDAYVLVNETGSYRVTRYWLTGDNAGQSDTFIDNLPGFPDGISFNGNGTFWLALFGPRNALLDFTADKPWLRRIIYHLPEQLQPAPPHVGHVLGLNVDGQIVANFRQASEIAFAPITSVEQVGDQLYLGSLTAPAFARMPAPSGARKQ